MQRSSFCSLAVLAFFAAGLALAEDTKVKNDKGTSLNKATIATIDSKKDTIPARSNRSFPFPDRSGS